MIYVCFCVRCAHACMGVPRPRTCGRVNACSKLEMHMHSSSNARALQYRSFLELNFSSRINFSTKIPSEFKDFLKIITNSSILYQNCSGLWLKWSHSNDNDNRNAFSKFCRMQIECCGEVWSTIVAILMLGCDFLPHFTTMRQIESFSDTIFGVATIDYCVFTYTHTRKRTPIQTHTYKSHGLTHAQNRTHTKSGIQKERAFQCAHWRCLPTQMCLCRLT